MGHSSSNSNHEEQNFKATENSSLLSEKPKSTKACDRAIGAVKSTVASVVAVGVSLPTAFLNFLGALNIDIGSINTSAEFIKELTNKSPGELAAASASAFSSLTVNIGTNFVYVPQNSLNLIKLVRDLFIVAVNGVAHCANKNKPFSDDHITRADIFTKFFSFLGAFAPALAFASIGYDEITFIDPVAYTLFVTNGTSYWMTRFSGISQNISNIHNRRTNSPQYQINAWINKLKIVADSGQPLVINYSQFENNPEERRSLQINVLKDYLKGFQQGSQDHFPISKPKQRMQYVATVLGWLMAITTGLVTLPIWAARTLEGFEKLTHAQWFINSNSSSSLQSSEEYQGAGQLAFGYAAGSPNSFFYALANFLLPFILFDLATNLYKIKNQQKTGAFIGYIILTLIITAMCAWSGEGMADVSGSVIEDGYLDYMGLNPKVEVWPSAIYAISWLGASSVNLRACLFLLNEKLLKKRIVPDVDNIEEMNPYTAIALLESLEPVEQEDLIRSINARTADQNVYEKIPGEGTDTETDSSILTENEEDTPLRKAQKPTPKLEDASHLTFFSQPPSESADHDEESLSPKERSRCCNVM